MRYHGGMSRINTRETMGSASGNGGASARAERGRRLVRFARTHAVLCVSAVAAAFTMFFVPPDAAYLGYFDFKVLACLFGILAVVVALRNVHVFELAARALVARFSTCRAAVGALVGATLVLSMFATNDMALIMMLPLAATTLLKAGWERALPFAFIMQNLAANLGGMILPFGNPQNLYLFERFHISLGDFLGVMAVPFGVSIALIALCCFLFVKPDVGAARTNVSRETFQPEPARASSPAQGVPAAATAAFAEAPAGEASIAEASVASPLRFSRRSLRIAAYVALLLLVIASVFRLVPYPVAFVAVVVALAALDRGALRSVDLGLLLTFACFFVFAGNMARIPAVEQLLGDWMHQSALLTSVGASQVISNVPAAILLSQVADGFPALLVGVNIGGAGTLVASLASLITFNQYRAVHAAFGRRPGLADQGPGRFVLHFTVYNIAFLAVLLVVCFPLFS